MNQRNLTIKLFNSFQPEIRLGRVVFYLKSGREELYSVYLWMALDLAKQILNQITRKASRKLDIDKIVF